MLIKIITFIVPTVILVQGYNNLKPRPVHPDIGLNVKQLIEKYGFQFENHTIQTADGYLLELHRIPHGRNDHRYKQQVLPPALLVPGFFCSSADFVNMGENSLGFILSDQGYDVWLLNYRGTTWSRKHITLNPDEDKKEFWTYSFHQIGIYDIAASIDHILKATNQEKLYYIGHSQGTTSFFALTSTKPEYNNKIRLSIALAPVGYSSNMKSIFVHFAASFHKELDAYLNKYHKYEIMPYRPFVSLLGRIFCNDRSPFQTICAHVFFFIAGHSPDQFNKSTIPVITSNAPAGASMRQIQHYAQLYTSKKFHQYDYGEEENLKIYGQLTPPEYDVKKITVPLAFYYGNRDPFSIQQDIDKIASELPNLVVNKLLDGFSHLDVLWGIDAVKLIFNDVVGLMREYQ